jgi:outer membrane protein
MVHYGRLLCFVLAIVTIKTQAQDSLLTLPAAMQLALQNNFDIQISKNNQQVARINNAWENTALLPTVSATANKALATNNITQELSNNTTLKRNGAAVNNFNAGLAINWQVFDGLQMFATKKRLAELEKIGNVNFTRMANQTAYNVITAYYDIVRLKQQKKAVEETIILFKERLKIAESRLTIGTGNKPDVLQAQVDLNEQQAALFSIENSIALGKTNLNNILSRDPAILYDVQDSFAINKNLDTRALLDKISNNNPDVMLARSNIAVLIQARKEIVAQQMPGLNFNSNYNFIRNRNQGGFILLNQSYGPSVNFGLTVPIFNGGAIKKQLQTNDVNRKNLDIQLMQLNNQLLTAYNSALLNYKNGLQLAALEQQNLAAVNENNYINTERFKKAAITAIEFRQGQVNYTTAQTRLINALFQTKVAEADLLLLAGEITGYN